MDGSEMPDTLNENNNDDNNPSRGAPHLRLVHGGGNPPRNNSPWLASLAQGTIFLARDSNRAFTNASALQPFEVKFQFKKSTLLSITHPDERTWYQYVDTMKFSNTMELFEVIYEPPKGQENEDQHNWSDQTSDVEHVDHVET
jgi:hypothetical protein